MKTGHIRTSILLVHNKVLRKEKVDQIDARPDNFTLLNFLTMITISIPFSKAIFTSASYQQLLELIYSLASRIHS
jgi:hypothetical protein